MSTRVDAPCSRPQIAVTLGDVAGIGPEVAARALLGGSMQHDCRPVVVGDADVLRRTLRLLGHTEEVVPLSHLQDVEPAAGRWLCWNPSTVDVREVSPGQVDSRAGRAAYEWLVAATKEALAGRLDAIVTAPLNKAGLKAAGLNYPGHTEILAEECGVDDFAMMLYLPPDGNTDQAGMREKLSAALPPFGLAVAHVTLHTSVASVPGLLSTPGIKQKIDLVDRFLKQLGAAVPRVGVCALNPHAGENGLFGDEEARIIAPAVKAAVQGGVSAVGPLPADTLLKRALAGEFDGVVAMYHDQGHIALKLIGFNRAVNVTLGLPIVRTSPSHGTAYDIAGKGVADSAGMEQAIRVAVALSAQRQNR